MKKFLLFTFLLVSFLLTAQELQLVPSTSGIVIKETKASEYVSRKQTLGGVLYEDFNQTARILMMQKDAPALPVYAESIIIPAQGNPQIEVTYDGFVDFADVNVLPSKGSLKRNINPADVPYQNGPVYQQDAFFPGQLAQLSSPFIFRNHRGANLQVYPFQYNPVSKTLRVYRNLTVKIITSSESGANELSVVRERENQTFTQLYSELFINSPAYAPIADEGELLVIVPQEYTDVIAPYVSWKTERGMKTTVVSTAEIGGDSESIRNYIADFYAANPNLSFVQLVGDHEQLPTHTYGITGADEQLWSDSYYGQLAGDDFFPEVLVGRFSGSVSHVKTMIDRTLEYETDPMQGEWMLGAVGIGSNEGYGYGDDEEADWQHLRGINEKLGGFGYSSFYEFFEGSQGGADAPGNPTASMINGALNAGVGLVNYAGHGAQNVMSTGDYSISNVNQLTNTGMYPLVVSVACNNGTFVGGTALCEAFVRRTFNGLPAGAIASCGSSILMAWAEPMQTQDEMTELIIRSNSENRRNSIGGIFYNGQLSMMEAYGLSPTAVEVMQTWVMFGDVTTHFRSQQSQLIAANHQMEISSTGGTINVVANLDDALVALTQDGEILATAMTANGGFADFELPEFSSSSPIKVTITKPNTTPYRGQVEITTLGTDAFASQFTVYPNPVRGNLTIASSWSEPATVRVHDIHGRTLFSDGNATLQQYTVPALEWASGVYFLTVESNGKSFVKKLLVP